MKAGKIEQVINQLNRRRVVSTLLTVVETQCSYCGHVQNTVKPWVHVPYCRKCRRPVVESAGVPLFRHDSNGELTFRLAGGSSTSIARPGVTQ